MSSGDRHHIEGVSSRSPRRGGGFPWLRAAAFVIVLGAVVLPFTPPGQRILRGVKKVVVKTPADSGGSRAGDSPELAELEQKIREIEARSTKEIEALKARRSQLEEELKQSKAGGDPTPAPPVTDPTALSGGDVRDLRSGIPFKSQVVAEKGGLASKERVTGDSYVAEYTLRVRVPEPSKTLEQLQTVNPELGRLLPGLAPMMEKAEVSRWFYGLYENKTRRIRADATNLAELLTKHNFFDCETILNLQNPDTKRKAFLLQAEMDVVSDGSDGDRLPTMPDEIVNSSNYQPSTSYGWPKRTAVPNPMIAGLEKRIKGGRAEMNAAGTTAERKKWLRTRIAELERIAGDLKARSYLIAEYDPFIVIPVNIIGANDPYAPQKGDYAVVVHGKKLYPAIVGDAGPSFKVGEASLRIAREINPRSSPYSRPESNLVVTYLVFPGSRDATPGPPDYEKWWTRCSELLKECGGLGEGVELHRWQNLLPDLTPPAPPPSPPGPKAGTGTGTGTGTPAPSGGSVGTAAPQTPPAPSPAPASPGGSATGEPR